MFINKLTQGIADKKQRRIKRLQVRNKLFSLFCVVFSSVTLYLGWFVFLNYFLPACHFESGMQTLGPGILMALASLFIPGYAATTIYGFRYPLHFSAIFKISALSIVLPSLVYLLLAGIFETKHITTLSGLTNCFFFILIACVVSITAAPFSGWLAYLVHKFILGAQKAPTKQRLRI